MTCPECHEEAAELFECHCCGQYLCVCCIDNSNEGMDDDDLPVVQ